MSREEALNKAIGVLTYYQVNFCKSKEAVANMNEIIDALEKIDQECVADKDINVTATDCIRRQDVEDAIYDYSRSCDVNYAQIMEYIDKIPSVTPQPCEDAVSRQAVLDAIDAKAWEFCDYLIREGRNDEQKPVSHFADNLRECVGEGLPSVTPQQKMERCKNCKYFEYDSVAKVDGIPLIVAHEICKRWSDGCQTKEDGYCFLFEPQEGSDGE